MSRGSVLSLVFVAVVLAAAVTAAREPMVDPYEIMKAYYQAIGGLERLKEEKSIHFVSDISISGLSGTVEYWQIRPDRSRMELDLGVIKQTMGDDGTTAWELDTNGKLRIERDANALARREVERRLALFEHLDPASDVFTVTLDGTTQVDGAECYVIRVASTLDNAVRTWYVNASEFLMKKSENSQPDEHEYTVYSDYREVNGVLHAFRQDIEIWPPGQSQVILTTLVETGVEINPSLFEAPEGRPRDFVFTGGGDHAEVPFQFIINEIFVPVTLNCRQSLWVLDSGASVSVIDRGYAEQLGLPISGQILGEGAGNSVEVAFTTLPPFAVSGIEFQEQQVAVIDFVDLFRRVSDLEVVGILGYDFLSRFVTKVDYANEMLTFYEPEGFEYAGAGTVLDAPLRDNLFSVEASVESVYEGTWMLDLGASQMSFYAVYAKAHDLGNREGILGVAFGAGGRIQQYRSKYETVEFAGYAVENPYISMAGYGEDIRGEFSAGRLVGRLGNSLFRHFVLYLDYENQQVMVEKGDDFGEDSPRDRSGLQLWRPEEACEVLYVAPGTPAEEAGFREGDVAVAINGIGVEHLGGLLAVRDLLREEPGTEYDVAVEREGETRQLRLVLRELL